MGSLGNFYFSLAYSALTVAFALVLFADFEVGRISVCGGCRVAFDGLDHGGLVEGPDLEVVGDVERAPRL